jgi:hypothetical protein
VASDDDVLNILKQVTQSKAAKPVQSKVAPIVRRDSTQVQNLLGQLDKNPYRKPGTALPQPEAKPYYATGELSDIMDQFKNPKGIAGVLAGAVDILDISKRATISGLREFADTWDMNPETKASFSDWRRQTLDKGFGYGRAFPISNKTMLGRWAGRATGLIGDLVFDPINYLTLGTAIPVKGTIKFAAKEFAEMIGKEAAEVAGREAAEGAARNIAVKKVLDNGDVLVKARSVLGRHVVGRDGRAALGRFTKKRLTALRNAGEEGYQNLTDDAITEIAAKVYSDGKRVFVKHPNIPEGFAQSIGVRGPGVYYFGSRFKVPGTTTIGRLSEDAITDLRLYLSTTKAGKAVRTAATPKGVGRIMRFGTKVVDEKTGESVIDNTLLKARVNLADGTLLSSKEINEAMMVVEAHDIGRLRTAVHLEDGRRQIGETVDELAGVENAHIYLDEVPKAQLDALVARGNAGAIVAQKMRNIMDYLHARANARSLAVGGAPIPYRDGYFPHIETSDALQNRLKLGNDRFDAMMYGDEGMEPLARNQVPASDRRQVFHERTLKPGDKWFGVTLTEADMTADALNAIARRSGKVNFDMFETDVTRVFAGYLQQYSDQMGWFDTLEYLTKNYPDYINFSETLLKISPAYSTEMMKTRPNAMFRNLEQAIRRHSLFLDNALTSVRNELIGKHGSLETALIAMKEGILEPAEIENLLKALDEQIAIAGQMDEQYQKMLADIATQVENRDGVSGFNLFFQNTRSVQLTEKFEELKSLMKQFSDIKYETMTPEKIAEIAPLLDTFDEYVEMVGVLSRDIEFSAQVSDVFPALNNIGQYGAIEQYEIFAKIVDELGEPVGDSVARKEAVGWGPKSPTKHRMTADVASAVSRMTIDDIRNFMDDVRGGLLPGENDAAANKVKVISQWLRAKIVENEILGGQVGRGFREDYTDFVSVKSAQKKNKYDFNTILKSSAGTTFEQWRMAVERLRMGDVTGVEDLLIQQNALSTIYKWQEMYSPFGIQIGDDVIDEIVQREAREFAIVALRNGDTARFETLTSANFGRDGGTGPLGTNRLVERQRQIFEDMKTVHGFDAMQPLPPKSATTVVTAKGEAMARRISRLSEVQQMRWVTVARENQNVLNYVNSRMEFVRNARNNMKNVGDLQPRWDAIAERFDKALKFIDSGELFNITDDVATDGQILFDDLISEMYEIAKQIGDAARLSQDPIAARTIEDNWNSFIDTMANQIERTRFILNNYSPESKIYKQQKFEIRNIVRDGMLKELDSTKTIFFHNMNSGIDAMSDEMVRLTRMRRQAEYVLNNPEEYFRIGAGSLDAGDVDEGILAAPRSLDEGGKVIDRETGEFISPTEDELDVIIADYRNSEQYPIARATENNANRAHSLVHVNLSEMPAEYMPGGVTFTRAEWDRIVHGGFVETGSPVFDRFMSALRAERATYLDDSLQGADVSDEKLIDGFVDFVVANFRETDAVVQHNKVLQYRRKQILANWKKSEHYSWLQDYRTYEQRKFAKAFAANAADEVRQLDAASNVITYVRETAKEAAVDVPAYTFERRKALAQAFNDFVVTMRKAEKRVMKPESKVAFKEEASGDIQRVVDKTSKPIVAEDDSVTSLIDEALGMGQAAKTEGSGVSDVESRTFLGTQGEGREVADFEALPITGLSGADEVLLLRNKESAKVVDSFLKGSNVEKTTQQLEREIGILETLRNNKMDTPYTRGKSKAALIRQRQAELFKRSGDSGRMATARTPRQSWSYGVMPFDDFEKAVAYVKKMAQQEGLVLSKKKDVERLKYLIDQAASKTKFGLTAELETAVTAVTGPSATQLDNMVVLLNKFIDASVKPNKFGKYNRGLNLKPKDIEYYTERLFQGDFDYELDELAELDDLHSGFNWKTLPATETVSVPKSVAPVATDVPEDAAAALTRELEAVAGKATSPTTEVQRVGQEVADQKAVVDKLQAKYDQATAAAQAVDEAQVVNLQSRVKVLQDLIDGTEIDVRAGRGIQSTFDYSDGISWEYTKHQEAKRFLEYANDVLTRLGAKADGDFDGLDAILRAQIASETEVHLAVAGMKSAQHDRLMLQGVQQMLDGGGKLLPSGQVQLSNGLIVDGVPVDAVMEFGKGIRTGWDSISKNFPNLYGSPEMVELLNNAARFEDPEFIRKMAYYIGPYTKLFKAFAVLSPGFHARNGLANAIQLALAGVEMDNAIQATKIYKRWLDASKEGKSFNEFVSTLDPLMQDAVKTARNGSIGSGGGIYSEVMKEASGSRIMDWWLIRKNYSLGQASDNYSRFVLSFDSAMKGNDQFTAAARVKRFYFDYEDLSTLDKVMKQFMPFWLFYSRNMHTQITNMWLNPRPYHIYYNIKNNISDREEPNPPFVEEMGGFKLPFGDGLYAMPDFGFTRIQKELTDLTNPMKMIPKMNPLFVVPFEQITGRDSYTGREFAGVDDRLMNALTSLVPPAQQADKLIMNDNPMSKLNAWLSYMGSPIRKYN